MNKGHVPMIVNSDSEPINRLLLLGKGLEHKFSTGHAMDIRHETIHEIIQETIRLGRNSSIPYIRNRLNEIENVSYAILNTTYQDPKYFQLLRALVDMLHSLGEIT
jgi:hypothetical protein